MPGLSGTIKGTRLDDSGVVSQMSWRNHSKPRARIPDTHCASPGASVTTACDVAVNTTKARNAKVALLGVVGAGALGGGACGAGCAGNGLAGLPCLVVVGTNEALPDDTSVVAEARCHTTVGNGDTSTNIGCGEAIGTGCAVIVVVLDVVGALGALLSHTAVVAIAVEGHAGLDAGETVGAVAVVGKEAGTGGVGSVVDRNHAGWAVLWREKEGTSARSCDYGTQALPILQWLL